MRWILHARIGTFPSHSNNLLLTFQTTPLQLSVSYDEGELGLDDEKDADLADLSRRLSGFVEKEGAEDNDEEGEEEVIDVRRSFHIPTETHTHDD